MATLSTQEYDQKRIDSGLLIDSPTSSEPTLKPSRKSIVHKAVSFSEDLTIHSHEDWHNRLKHHRLEKKSRLKKANMDWAKFKSQIIQLLKSCGPSRSSTKLEDLESVGILSD